MSSSVAVLELDLEFLDDKQVDSPSASHNLTTFIAQCPSGESTWRSSPCNGQTGRPCRCFG